MKNIVRYLATGRNFLNYHTYSNDIKDAYHYAVECAKHPSMLGEVYAIYDNGEKELIWEPQK